MEYIYLDWNVIQYMKRQHIDTNKSINGTECEKVVTTLSKKYKFPVSEGHLKDLAVSFKPENYPHIHNDLIYLTQLSKGYVLTLDSDENLIPRQGNICDFFRNIVNKNETEPTIEVIGESYSVDMEKLPTNDLFRPLLETNNGILDSAVFGKFILQLWENIDDPEFYKLFRNQVSDIKNKCANTDTIIDQKSDYFKKVIPFLDFLVTNDLQILKNNFYEAMKAFASIDGRDFDSFTQGKKIEQAYALLDFHPKFRDKINKKNRPSNMFRDIKNLFFASQAKYYITEDQSTFDKASFVSDVLSLKVKVLKMGEFCHRFS